MFSECHSVRRAIPVFGSDGLSGEKGSSLYFSALRAVRFLFWLTVPAVPVSVPRKPVPAIPVSGCGWGN